MLWKGGELAFRNGIPRLESIRCTQGSCLLHVKGRNHVVSACSFCPKQEKWPGHLINSAAAVDINHEDG